MRWLPADDLAVRQAGREAVAIDRAVDVVLDVLLARPDHLDRSVDLLGDAHGLRRPCPTSSRRPKPPPSRWLWTMTFSSGRPVTFAAAACARASTCVPTQTSQPSGVTCTVQFIGSIGACARNGSSIGGVEPVALAQRLWRHRRCFGDRARPSRWRRAAASSTSADRDAGVRPVVPGDVERVEALLGRPHMIADHRDEIVEHDDLADAGHRLGLRCRRHAPTLPPNTGQAARVANFTPGGMRVDAVDRLAVDLVRRVEPLQRLADQRKSADGLQRRIRRRRQRRGRGRPARRRRACGRWRRGAPRRSRCGRSPDRRSTSAPRPAPACARAAGAGLAQRHPEGADRIGIAGRLEAEHRIGVERLVRRRVLAASPRRRRRRAPRPGSSASAV